MSVQVVHVYAAGVQHSSEYEVFCISGGSVKAGDNAYYHDIIHIPPLPASGLDGCNIIDIEYHIKVRIIIYKMPFPVAVIKSIVRCLKFGCLV